MTDNTAHPCDAFSDNLAELALGILTGRERAATLAHVDACSRCAEELEQLSHAADSVVSVAPELEPTMGFEVRLFERMGLAETPVAPSVIPSGRRIDPLRWVARSPRWALVVAAAAVALIIGLSVGWSAGSGQTGGSGAEVATGNFVSNGSTVGSVHTYGGSRPWMIVTLADSWTDGKVTCEVVTADGVTHRVGTFTAKDGYGAWGAPLRVAPQDVRKAEVVSASGKVIATASLTAS
jgi:hypothetical protein